MRRFTRLFTFSRSPDFAEARDFWLCGSKVPANERRLVWGPPMDLWLLYMAPSCVCHANSQHVRHTFKGYGLCTDYGQSTNDMHCANNVQYTDSGHNVYGQLTFTDNLQCTDGIECTDDRQL
jgi:hypothetical protein